MKKTIFISLISGLAGLAIGYKVPKEKNFKLKEKIIRLIKHLLLALLIVKK